MNFPQPVASSNPQPPQLNAPLGLPDDGDELHLLDILDVVLDNRWLIAAVTSVALVIGVAYVLLATPIYEANTLIQVEDSKAGGVGSLLGDVSGMFDIKSPATAEIEILRSRLVVGQAVTNLKLDIAVRPKYVPVVGRWLASRATTLSEPGFLGMAGYVSGNERLDVARMQVPTALEGERLILTLAAQGYTLQTDAGADLGKGEVGAPLTFVFSGKPGNLLITAAIGKPGAQFYLQATSRLAVTEELQTQMSIVEQGKQSGVIRSSLQGADPARIASVLNEIGALYVRQNIDRKAAEAEKSLRFLGTQLPQLRRELENSEQKFNDFRNKTATFDLGSEAKVLLDQAVTLRVKLLELQQKREELATRFTPAHPSMQVLDAQIREIGNQISNIENRGKTFPNVEQDLLRLTRDVKVNNELYTGLLNSFQQLRLVKEGKVGNVRMVDVAAVPEWPVKPKRSTSIALAGVLGVLLGLALAFLRNNLKPGLKNPDDIETRLGLPVFATVPHSESQALTTRHMRAKKPGNHVLAVAEPRDPVIESLRSLRTAFQFAMLDASSNIVLITGPTPGIGKSFTSVNFAAVMGAADKRVLLVDADLRKGHLNQYFNLPREGGLSEVISGAVALGQVIRRNVAPNVDFLSTGVLPPNPAELLVSPATQALLANLGADYDLVIIDTPPVLAASDTAVLAALVGAVFLVARAEISTLGELQEATRRLAQSGVQARGVIFNDVDVSKRRYGYGVGYRYGKYRYINYKY